MYADKCSHPFGNVWRRTISGNMRTFFVQPTGPANLLFRFDKVRHRSTSALISNSPLLTFTLVSSGGKRVGEGERVKTEKVMERRLPRTNQTSLESPEAGKLVRRRATEKQLKKTGQW